jgi:hypothetical protein
MDAVVARQGGGRGQAGDYGCADLCLAACWDGLPPVVERRPQPSILPLASFRGHLKKIVVGQLA